MVNLVTINSKKYQVDVGFGSNGPAHPYLLEQNGAIQPNVRPGSGRLVWKNIPGNTDPDQRLWVYQHRIKDDAEFRDIYCFTELEFLPQDYSIMNYYTSTNPKCWFTHQIVCVRHLVKNDELIGTVIIQSGLKIREYGQTVKEEKFETEDDRLQALKEYFGIEFGPEDRDGITKLTSQIGPGFEL
jgi:arylamine N-acetyltransferase